MPDIRITVRDKIAQTVGMPEIVCGNSDYTVIFDLDSEWDRDPVKTARFVWRDAASGTILYEDAVFDGDRIGIPPVYRTDLLLIGVYAGDIRTTTPARIPCCGCISDSASDHPDPSPDVYEQLMAYLEILVGKAERIMIGIPAAAADGIVQTESGIATFSEVE